MSADNGIYILQCKDQCRVIYAFAIDNLWWSYAKGSYGDISPVRVVEYFSKAKSRAYSEAREYAFRMYEDLMSDDDFMIVEHGINTIQIDKCWHEIVSEAKEIGVEELRTIISSGCWQDYLPEIKFIVSLYEKDYEKDNL